MPMTIDKMNYGLIQPFITITFHDSLFTPHATSVSASTWIEHNAKYLKSHDQRIWLRHLLTLLKKGKLRSRKPLDVLINPYHAINFSLDSQGSHPPIFSESKWVECNIKLLEQCGIEEWLRILIKTLEYGPLTADEVEYTTAEELKEHITKIIDLTLPLKEAQVSAPQETTPEVILEGSFRKNLTRLRSIQALCVDEELSKTSLEIARNMLEDVISIEYIFENEETQASLTKRFFDFFWVQGMQDMNFHKEIAENMDEDMLGQYEEYFARITAGYNKIIEADPKDGSGFLRKDGTLKHSWLAPKGVDELIKHFQKTGSISDGQLFIMLVTYTEGSRHTHFNPSDLGLYLDEDALQEATTRSFRMALIMGGASLIWIARRYVTALGEAYGDVDCDQTLKELDQLESLLAQATIGDDEWSFIRAS